MNRTHWLSLVVTAGWFAAGFAEPPSVSSPTAILAPPGEPASAIPPEHPAGTTPKLSDATRQPAGLDGPSRMPNLPPSALEKSLDIRPDIRVRGRIEADALLASQSAQSIATIGDLQNGFGFRRVRLGAQGTIGDAANWVSEVELAGGTVRLRDVFVGLTAFPYVRETRVGFFREPFSLEGATSSNFITFLERSPLNNLDPARNWGVCNYWWPDDERGLFAVGVFRSGTSSTGQSVGDEDAWAVTTRATRLVVYEPDAPTFRLVHLGGAFSYRSPAGGVANFSPSPGSNLLTVEDSPRSPFLPTVAIPANSIQQYNLQAARVVGPYSLQGEWFAAAVQQTAAGVVFVHGFYVDGSYFLTGEHRGYNRTRGSFDQVRVLRPLLRARDDRRGGYGAIELTARLSFTDFNSSSLPTDEFGLPAGTLLYQMTFGANWYLNDYTRVMINYTPAITDRTDQATVSSHTFGLRVAVYW